MTEAVAICDMCLWQLAPILSFFPASEIVIYSPKCAFRYGTRFGETFLRKGAETAKEEYSVEGKLPVYSSFFITSLFMFFWYFFLSCGPF